MSCVCGLGWDVDRARTHVYTCCVVDRGWACFVFGVLKCCFIYRTQAPACYNPFIMSGANFPSNTDQFSTTLVTRESAPEDTAPGGTVAVTTSPDQTVHSAVATATHQVLSMGGIFQPPSSWVNVARLGVDCLIICIVLGLIANPGSSQDKALSLQNMPIYF